MREIRKNRRQRTFFRRRDIRSRIKFTSRLRAKVLGVILAAISSSVGDIGSYAHDFPRENPISSGEIYAHCAKRSEWCKGYILGMTDAMLDAETMNKRSELFCLPKGTYTSDVTRAVLKNLKSTKPQWKGKGAFTIMDALHTVFPCKVP